MRRPPTPSEQQRIDQSRRPRSRTELANGFTGHRPSCTHTVVSRSDWPRPADEDRRPQKKTFKTACGHGDKSKHRDLNDHKVSQQRRPEKEEISDISEKVKQEEGMVSAGSHEPSELSENNVQCIEVDGVEHRGCQVVDGGECYGCHLHENTSIAHSSTSTPSVSSCTVENTSDHIVVDECKYIEVNAALREAIQSTAKTPQEADFLRAVLQQVDIHQFQNKQCKSPGVADIGRSIPSPEIVSKPLGLLGMLNVFEAEDMELLVNEREWEDVEFEVALDSGSIVNVCHPDDCPGYAITESAGSRAGQNFVVGDGGRLPNMGEWNLNLEAPKQQGVNTVSSIFQVAKVTRPLMSVGHICDQGLNVTFGAVYAIVRDAENTEVCRFTRGPSGLYTAKMKLKAPFGRQGS